MFQRYGKKTSSSQVKPLKDLIRMLTPDVLLGEEKRVALIAQIREVCALEPSRYDSLGASVIENLVRYCQQLPETSNSYYSQQGGLLDYALNRTEAALNLFRHYLIADEKTGFSEEQKLWQYALLTAALLQGISKLAIDYRVALYDLNGQCLQPWNPVHESMVSTGNYYTYVFEKETDVEFRRRLNIVLALQLMPASGFSWIASNHEVLAIWLALLNEDHYAAGTLGAILIRADAIAIQRWLNQLHTRTLATRSGPYGRVSTFSGAPDVTEIEQKIGVEFIQWLKDSLASGIIMVNKAPLLMVPGGLLMSADIFKWFVREHPEYKNWQAIQKGFASLGLHKMAADGDLVSRFEQNENRDVHSGVVFEKYAVALPSVVSLYSAKTGTSSEITATDLIPLVQSNNDFARQQQALQITGLQGLNRAGKWEVRALETVTLQKGSFMGG